VKRARAPRIPIWLRRLDLVRTELRTTRFPRTADEGFRAADALAADGWRMLREQVASGMRGARPETIDRATHVVLARMKQVRTDWATRWRGERGRYFGRR
jgi:hypothetical protein